MRAASTPAISLVALVVSLMAAPADVPSLIGASVTATLSDDTLLVRWPASAAQLRCAAPGLTCDGAPFEPTDGARTTRARSDGNALVVTFERAGMLRLEQTVRIGLDGTQVSVASTLTNPGERAVAVEDIAPLGSARLSSIGIGSGDDAATVYVDSGSQGGTHIARLDERRTCRGICAIHDPLADLSFVCANLSFEHDNAISVSPADGGVTVEARTSTPVTLRPGESHELDPILLDCRASPFEALERYADAVNEHVNPPIPEEAPCGWISWYGYRLTMTEETILADAEVIARHFLPYGVTVIQPDHGWQDRDICGNWVANEKFPHGMVWLRERLAQMGFELGLWAAPSIVSEYAPLFSEHPEALLTGPDGTPKVFGERWHWPPHGATYQIDPWSERGEAFLRDFARLMREYGISYLKSDFISTWGGARTLRRGMGILREALGPEIILRPCSTALNTNLGICNEIGIARDIGNAAGNWQHMRVETLELASKWFMHRRFWLNNPDSLIVGDANEGPGEAIGRVTLHALTGGVMFLADRMPDLERQPERLALVPLILPSSDTPARPIDLFRIGVGGREYPRQWHLHAAAPWGEWEVLGLFNWSEEPITETVCLRDLGLTEGRRHLVWDFWRGEPAGVIARDFEVAVPAGSARCLRIMSEPERPVVLSTDMHVTQGLVELPDVRWDADGMTLSGVARRAPGASGTVFVYLPPGWHPEEGHDAPVGEEAYARIALEFAEASAPWSVRFRRTGGEASPGLAPADTILSDPALPAL